MAKPVYCNYRLYKTLPKLSGNMQLDLVLGLGAAEKAYVRQAHLRPVAGTAYRPIVDERIMDRPHQNNIKRFYEQTRGLFYKSAPPAELASDWFMTISPHEMNNLKYIKTWDDSYLAGCQRMSYKLYGTSHEVLVPLWLDKCNGLKFIIKFVLPDAASGGDNIISYREVNISEEYLYGSVAGRPYPYNVEEKFHNDFTKYLMDYFKYVKIMDGNNSVMNVQFNTGISTISGLMVESGNLATRLNYNIVSNLTHRERPLLESNSLLTNTFLDYKMICSQLINFNLCFDMEEMMGPVARQGLLSGGNVQVKVDVEVIRPREDVEAFYNQTKSREDLYDYYARKTYYGEEGMAYKWVGPLEVRDFYTNHEYVPRPQMKYNYGTGSTVQYYMDDADYWWNALDYKKDDRSTEMMHKNKISQGICHWVYARQPDGNLFNVYDGFGAYVKDGDKTIIYDHGFGSTTDTTVDKFDPSADNTIWAGAPRIGDGDDVESTLDNAQYWIDNGYFKDATNFIGGLMFNFASLAGSPTTPRKLWLATMTTPWEANAEVRKTSATSYMTPRHAIGIRVERLGADGKNNLPRTRENQTAEIDKMYDNHYHSDVDNRFAIRKVKNGENWYLFYDPIKIKNVPDEIKKLMNSSNPKDRTEAYKWASKNWVIWWEPQDFATRPDESSARIRVGGFGDYNTSARQAINESALYVAMRRKTRGDHLPRPDDELCVILWHPRAKKTKTEVDTTNQVLFGDLYPHGLTVGGFTSAIKDYCNKYLPCIIAIGLAGGDPEGGIIQSDNLPNLEDLDALLQTVNSIVAPEIIWFNRSIEPKMDYTLSRNAQEIKYLKSPTSNSYVLRYSGNIKPAMFPEKVIRNGGLGEKDHLTYVPTFGRNFMYQKSVIFPYLDLSEEQRAFISTNVPPLYPSLKFDSIVPITRQSKRNEDGTFVVPECRVSLHGDTLYNEPLPIFFGYTNTSEALSTIKPYKDYYMPEVKGGMDRERFSYQTFAWYEYKWFDRSRIMMLPKKLTYTIVVPENDEKTLERAAHAAMAWPMDRSELQGTPGVDKYFEFNHKLEDVPIRQRYIVKDGERIPPISLKGTRYVLDSPFLRNTYDLEFNLINTAARMDKSTNDYIRDARTKQVLYEYTYEVIATLK